ncbi:hypothetical protein LWI28_019004 [Acer negundo]|uniref:Beta-glucosidase n=1 Tax=Acer negundo TaxID=4023 RepID=A0AAD5I7C9_ACENE|nr:hypothetical protein LWI28_019004 [Acer negundo]
MTIHLVLRAGKITDFSNADVAVDQYYRFAEDIPLKKDMGMVAYRFSIAWSQIFPNGSGEINQAGVDHYNNLINALLAKGVEPYVNHYHWDLPQALVDKYNGCIFGDRVKHWITFNEPHTFAVMWACKYLVGIQSFFVYFVRAGNLATEPYIVAQTEPYLLSGLNLHQTPRKTKSPRFPAWLVPSNDQ